MPLISVILPAYNAERTIQKTIESVLKQKFYDWELIVINDGSTDLTLKIISHIQDSRIQVISYANAGAGASRNRGLSKASGEFITFIDADDIWTPDKLEKQHEMLEKNPDATVVYSWTNAIDETGNFLRQCSHSTWKGDVYTKLLLDDFIGSGSNVMIRRQAFNEVGRFDESLTNAEDTDMWLRLAAHYDFVVVPSPQILYRISSKSKSSINLLNLEKSNLQVIEKAFAQEKATNYQHLKRCRIANLYKYLSYKALAAPPGLHNSLHATRFLWLAVKNDPSLVVTPVIYKAMLKLAIISILSPNQANVVLNKFPRLSNISTLFGYVKLNFR